MSNFSSVARTSDKQAMKAGPTTTNEPLTLNKSYAPTKIITCEEEDIENHPPEVV